MELYAVQQEQHEAEREPILAVAYYEHVFKDDLTNELPNTLSHIQEIIDHGFNHVVVCVTEKDIESPERLQHVASTVEAMHARGLTVWADPWAVGGVFGGEAPSRFKTGASEAQRSCGCNDEISQLTHTWVDAVVKLGFDAAFWDEPEFKHRDTEGKRIACPGISEREFMRHCIAYAHAKGLSSAICLMADEHHPEEQSEFLAELARHPGVIVIGTDPYLPNAFNPDITYEDVESYLLRWDTYEKQAAEPAGVEAMTWVNTFQLEPGHEDQPRKFIDIIRRHGIRNIGAWAFRACGGLIELNPYRADTERTWKELILDSVAA